MEHLGLIFWIIIILLSIIFSMTKKKTPEKEGEEGEILERLLGVFSDEEQPQPVILTTQAKTTPEAPPPLQPRPPKLPPQLPRKKESQYHQRLPAAARNIVPAREKEIRLFEEEMDIDLIRQGIILSEILGPPRAEKPF